MKRQHGFSLIASIFLLTVVASLVVFMGNLRVVQQTTVAYSLRGAAAMQAARAGIEWGVYRTLNAGGLAPCPANETFTPTDAVLSAYSILVQCADSLHQESTSLRVYRITATASAGNFGTLDFVQRRLQVTVSLNPP